MASPSGNPNEQYNFHGNKNATGKVMGDQHNYNQRSTNNTTHGANSVANNSGGTVNYHQQGGNTSYGRDQNNYNYQGQILIQHTVGMYLNSILF